MPVPGVYLEPIAIEAAAAPNRGLPLLGGPARFGACRVAHRADDGTIARRDVAVGASADETAEAIGAGAAVPLDNLTAPRSPFAGLDLDRPLVMGILNVTPDSFSDGGRHVDPGRAVAAGRAMAAAGAAIVDVGGESTRPGAEEVDAETETGRVVPVIRGLAEAGIVVSVDTRHARVMAAAIEAGARIVNDVSALSHDPASLATVAESEAAVVLMHMRGTPATMRAAAHYDDVVLDVYDDLAAALGRGLEAGIAADRIALDPGLGFAKTQAQNLELLAHIGMFHGLGAPLCLGASRKLKIGPASAAAAPADRLGVSLAAALWAAERGVRLLRVHDVAATVQALELVPALLGADEPR